MGSADRLTSATQCYTILVQLQCPPINDIFCFWFLHVTPSSSSSDGDDDDDDDDDDNDDDVLPTSDLSLSLIGVSS